MNHSLWTCKRKPRRAARRGFTLMEILIVLAILAVIIGLVLPNLIGAQKGANLKAAKVAIRSVEQAVEMYAADHEGEFPAGGQGLDVLLKGAGDAKWKGPYVKGNKVPADPWGNPIQYQYPGTHQSDGAPDIWSMGPDKQSNTADDITNWSNTP
jgi:general secretion pathway protein G